MQNIFSDIFANLYLPVIVCKNNPDFDIVYMNIRANLLLSPNYSVEELSSNSTAGKIKNLLKFRYIEEYNGFYQAIQTMGHLDNYQGEIMSFDGKPLNYSISVNTVTISPKNDYIIFYLIEKKSDNIAVNFEIKLAELINAAFLAKDTDDAIKTVLAFSGKRINASRVYIFEEISAVATKNTYEWCASDIESMIENLSCLKKEDYNYDVIVQAGMYITDDVRMIEPDEDRKILEMQGIKSIAMLHFMIKTNLSVMWALMTVIIIANGHMTKYNF